MFKICTAFDMEYWKYGYPLLCSVLNKYPTDICVFGINFTKQDMRRLRRMDGRIEVFRFELDIPKNHLEFHKRCYGAKVDALYKCLETTKDNVALIDADCLFLDRLDAFEVEFNEGVYDLGVMCRPEKEKEYLKFCSHNVFLRNHERSRVFVKDWLTCIPHWDHLKFGVGNAYAEQACMHNSYILNRDKINLLDTSQIDIPILHAKGAKYSFHAKYAEVQYDQKCADEISIFETRKDSIL